MLIFVTPAITTRLLAEEQRIGTIELLLTAPVRDWELVIGKWLGGFMLAAHNYPDHFDISHHFASDGRAWH